MATIATAPQNTTAVPLWRGTYQADTGQLGHVTLTGMGRYNTCPKFDEYCWIKDPDADNSFFRAKLIYVELIPIPTPTAKLKGDTEGL